MYDSAELGVDLEQHRRRVHLALVRLAVEREALREREEARGGLVAEAARAEVHADPHAVVLVRHHVDVVVARADRAELRLRELRQLPLRRELRVADAVEHRVVGALGRRHAHAERDAARDLAHHGLDAAERVEVGRRSGRSAPPCCRSRCRSRRRTARRGPRRRCRRRSAGCSPGGGRRRGRRSRRRPRPCSARAARGCARRPRRTS